MASLFYFWAMAYKNLQQCISDLQKNGEVRIVSEEVSPDLDMASIHLDEFKEGKKTLLFESIKGSKYRTCAILIFFCAISIHIQSHLKLAPIYYRLIFHVTGVTNETSETPILK